MISVQHTIGSATKAITSNPSSLRRLLKSAPPFPTYSAPLLRSRVSIFPYSTDTYQSRSNNKPLYLHVGPSGDCWTGSSIFAAKHLQPDYVKSVELPEEGLCVEILVEVLEENIKMAQEIYDQGVLPKGLLDEVRSIMEEREQEQG